MEVNTYAKNDSASPHNFKLKWPYGILILLSNILLLRCTRVTVLLLLSLGAGWERKKKLLTHV